MPALKWFAWGYYGLAALAVVMAMAESSVVPVLFAVAFCLCAVLLQALSYGLGMLADIRAAVVGKGEPKAALSDAPAEVTHTADQSKPLRKPEDIANDLSRISAKI